MIDTPHGPMLFSPVPANQLMSGDLVVLPLVCAVTRLRSVSRNRGGLAGIQLVTDSYGLPVGLNDPVMRAVGARAAGVL
jgi:hypothetical protein